MIATWMLIFVAFVCHPEWMRDSRRFLIHSIETKADQVPEPWGARLEIIERIWRGDLHSDRLHDSLAAVNHPGTVPFRALSRERRSRIR
jgi:hypothetical protein